MSRTSKLGWGLGIVGVAFFALQALGSGTGPYGRERLAIRELEPLLPVVRLWWVLVLLGVVLVVYDRGFLDRIAGGGVGGGSVRGGPIRREDVIEATNWKRINSLAFRRSLGVSLIGAGAIGLLVSLPLGADLPPLLLSGAAVLIGILVVLTSRTSSREIKQDYTHRVSVRVPDLFSVHSFHVHLRQIAEDLGYVVRDDLSPGRGGGPAGFDEEVFLSEGGFEARKRPIAPPTSPFPQGSTLADLLNLTSLGMAGALSSVSLVLAAPGLLTFLLGGLLFVAGSVVLLYSYVTRTRRWAELYCVEEGTIYTPTANLYEEEPTATVEGYVHRDPTVSSTDTATELLVTIGARNSRYFEDAELAEDFETFVDRLEGVARENSYRIVERE